MEEKHGKTLYEYANRRCNRNIDADSDDAMSIE